VLLSTPPTSSISYLSATARGEYFNDDNGARGIGAEVYEATAGLEISPFPTNTYLSTLLFRPELREDWSGEKAFGVNNIRPPSRRT